MSCPFNKEALEKLKQFTDLCGANPDVLSLPELSFFRKYIESLGGKIPTSPKMSAEAPRTQPPAEKEEDVDTEPESDLELDTEGCVTPDVLEESQKMGDAEKKVSEEDSDKSDEKRSEAMGQIAEGNIEKAIALYTEAIELNPSSALLFSKRGQAYLRLTKPNACIKDCTRALELNPDSAAAYKFRGRAYRLLGEWENAAKDLRQACNIDLDEDIDEWLKEVTPNAKKIEQHKLKLERKKLEKEEREKLERIRKAREAHAKANTANQNQEVPSAGAGFEFPEGMNAEDPFNFMQDPDLMGGFTDPDISAALGDISSNPANLYKYKSNPKIMAFLAKISKKLGSAGLGGGAGFPGGFPGFPGFPGAAAAGGAPEADVPKFTPADDDNLD